MEKTTSAAAIVRDPVTRDILCCHPTGHRKYVMDLPKGMIDEGESPADAVVRELFEETGLAIDRSEFRDLGHWPYAKNKDIHFFYVEREIDLHDLKCSSFFENDEGRILPEMNGFARIPYDSDRWYPVMRKALSSALKKADLAD